MSKGGSRALHSLVQQLGTLDPELTPGEMLKEHFDNLPRSLRRVESCWGRCKTRCGCCNDHSLDRAHALLDIDVVGRSLQRRFANSSRVRNVMGKPCRY